MRPILGISIVLCLLSTAAFGFVRPPKCPAGYKTHSTDFINVKERVVSESNDLTELEIKNLCDNAYVYTYAMAGFHLLQHQDECESLDTNREVLSVNGNMQIIPSGSFPCNCKENSEGEFGCRTIIKLEHKCCIKR